MYITFKNSFHLAIFTWIRPAGIKKAHLVIHREIKVESIGLKVSWIVTYSSDWKYSRCRDWNLPDDKWEWWDARLGWRDELGLSLAFNKRFASSLPPEDVLDSTSLTPLSAGLAGSDPLPVYARWNRNATEFRLVIASRWTTTKEKRHSGRASATFCTLT